MYELHKGTMWCNATIKSYINTVHRRSSTRSCHMLLSLARLARSSKEPLTQSWSRDPSGTLDPPLTYAHRVRRTSLSAFMRRICPAYLNLRFRIASTKSYSGFVAVAQCGRFVMVCRHLLLNPFSILLTSSVRSHASQACVSVEQTEDLYRRIFIGRCRRWSFQIWYKELKRAWAMSILYFTSALSSPSHCVRLPRYSKEYTLSISFPSTDTCPSFLSCAIRFCFCTALSARDPLRDRVLAFNGSPKHHLRPLWIDKPCFVGKSLVQSGQTNFNFSAAISSVSVLDTRTRLCMCMAFVLGMEISIAASCRIWFTWQMRSTIMW